MEVLYEAQNFFPSKCVTCPMLIGLIEDGYISPAEISREEVMDGMREHCQEMNFEACSGPLVSGDLKQESITCTLIKGVE